MTRKKITGAQIAEQKFKNWLTVRNAYARANAAEGFMPISEAAGREEYKSLTKALLSVANAHAADHNEQMARLKERFGGASVDNVVSLADGLRNKLNAIAQNAMKAGVPVENAEAVALNSYFGNFGYDQFAGLNFLAEQLWEQLTFVRSFIEEGDAIQAPTEIAQSAGAISRFRVPRVEISGASKTRLGDMNPFGDDRVYSNNLASISLLSEFKNAHTEAQGFVIEEEQQQALFGYARAVAPALAGFVLQNQLMQAVEMQIMQSGERIFVDGVGNAAYDGESGSYGLLSPAIQLALASAADASPLLASASDWASNPTKLIQKISNFNYKPASTSAPLPSNASAENVYKDVVRLLNLIALTNTNPAKVVLYMPTSAYSVLVNYLGTGTFNRNLADALQLAVGGAVKKVEIKTSGLLNARTNSLGDTQPNSIVAVVHGNPDGQKPIVSPFVTPTPRFTTGVVSEQRSSFAASLTFGGPLVLQRGQAFILAFDVAA